MVIDKTLTKINYIIKEFKSINLEYKYVKYIVFRYFDPASSLL